MTDNDGAAAAAEELPENDFTGVAPTAKTSKGGRPQAPVRQYFTNVKGGKKAQHPDSMCKYCNVVMKNKKPDSLVAHLLSCSVAPAEVKATLRAGKASKAPSPHRPVPSSSSTSGSSSAGIKRPATDGSITRHFAPSDPFNDDEHLRLHHLLLRAMIDCGVSFRFVDSVFTKHFIDQASGSRYTPPGKYTRAVVLYSSCSASCYESLANQR
jgi:hypothetical protein